MELNPRIYLSSLFSGDVSNLIGCILTHQLPFQVRNQNQNKPKQTKQSAKKQRIPQAETRHALHQGNSFSHLHLTLTLPSFFHPLLSPFLDLGIDVPGYLFLHRRRDPVWTMDLLLTKGTATEIPARYRGWIIARDHRVRPPPLSTQYHHGVNHLCRRTGSNNDKRP